MGSCENKKISFLGCFEIHKGRPHWEGIKQGCKDLNVNAEFIDTRRHREKVNGEIGIACMRDATNYLGDFSKKILWHCDYETDINEDPKLNAICLTSPNYQIMSKVKRKIYFLPQGSPRASWEKRERKKDLVFIGDLDYGVHKERTKLLMKLKERYNLDLFEKDHWDLKNIYPNYKIALSMNWNDTVYSTSNRPFLIMGHSGFCLAKDNPMMREMFNHVVYFKDFEDACKKIDYYLSHEDERENIRYAQWLEIQEKHLYKHRIKRLLEICDIV